MSDMERTWAFLLAAAQRGIGGWSSSRRAGSGRHCQHGCCRSPGEPSSEERVSTGMHRSSAKSKGCFPPPSGAWQALRALKAAGAERETTSHPVPHQHLRARGTLGWAEHRCSGSTGETLAAPGWDQAKQEHPHVPQKQRWGPATTCSSLGSLRG